MVTLTGQREQHDPVHDQHGPEDGQVKYAEPTTREAYRDSFRCGIPELELGQAADEGAEFLVLFGGQAGGAVFESGVIFVAGERGVEFGLEEGEEEVQEVDAQAVGDDVPALGEDDAGEEEEEEDDGGGPAVGHVGGRFVELGLVELRMSVSILLLVCVGELRVGMGCAP